MKIRELAAVFLILTTLTGCSATVEGSVADPVSTGGAARSADAAGEPIGEDRAKAIALGHASLSEADVTRLKVEYEIDDGVHQYDVEFHHGDYEYEYEVDAYSGAILSADKDKEDGA